MIGCSLSCSQSEASLLKLTQLLSMTTTHKFLPQEAVVLDNVPVEDAEAFDGENFEVGVGIDRK